MPETTTPLSAAQDAQKNMSSSTDPLDAQDPLSQRDLHPYPTCSPTFLELRPCLSPLTRAHGPHASQLLPSSASPIGPTRHPGRSLPLAHDVAVEGVEDALVSQLQGVVQDLHVPAALCFRCLSHLHSRRELLSPHLRPARRASFSTPETCTG